jgi:hypothetical protein
VGARDFPQPGVGKNPQNAAKTQHLPGRTSEKPVTMALGLSPKWGKPPTAGPLKAKTGRIDSINFEE